MAGDRYFTFKGFSGIDQSVSAMDLPSHASPDAANMEASGGMLSTAKGYRLAYASKLPAGVLSLLPFRRRSGGNRNSLLASTANGLYHMNTSGSWDRIIGAPGGTYEGVNYAYNGNDVIYLANGADQLAVYNGTLFSEATAKSGFDPASICLSNERLWAAAPSSEMETIYYSNEFSPEQWEGDGAGFIGIPSWDSSRIVAVRSLYNEVVVFKDRHIYRIYGTYPGEFGVARIHGEEGPCSSRVIVGYKDRVFFFNGNGICFYDGMRARNLGDDRIKRVLKDINTSFLGASCGARLGSKLYFAVPSAGSTVNDMVIEYDADSGAYMLRKGLSVSCFLNWDGKLLFGSSDGGVYEYGQGRTYASGKMESYWKTPRMDLGMKYGQKYTATMYTHIRGSGSMRIEADYGRRTKSKDIRLTGDMRLLRFRLRNKGRTVQYRFSNLDGSYFDMHAPQFSIETDTD